MENCRADRFTGSSSEIKTVTATSWLQAGEAEKRPDYEHKETDQPWRNCLVSGLSARLCPDTV
jgi:hypothetical protein